MKCFFPLFSCFSNSTVHDLKLDFLQSELSSSEQNLFLSQFSACSCATDVNSALRPAA